MLYYTILCCTILYYTVLHCTILYYTILILYYTILYYTILYYTILYYTILYYTILYYTILYYTILYYTILYYTILYYTILYYTTLHYTTLYYTIGHDRKGTTQESPGSFQNRPDRPCTAGLQMCQKRRHWRENSSSAGDLTMSRNVGILVWYILYGKDCIVCGIWNIPHMYYIG